MRSTASAIIVEPAPTLVGNDDDDGGNKREYSHVLSCGEIKYSDCSVDKTILPTHTHTYMHTPHSIVLTHCCCQLLHDQTGPPD